MQSSADTPHKKTRLVWKSDSHRLEMAAAASAAQPKSADRDRRRPPLPHTSSPIRPGSVPAGHRPGSASPYNSSPSPSGADSDYPNRRSNRSRSGLRTHFCDGIDTRGRHLGRPTTPTTTKTKSDCVRDSVHECAVLRRRCSSAEDLERKLEHTQAEAAMLETNRRELMCRLREAELDGRAAARQVQELQELVRNLRRNDTPTSSCVGQADGANLSKQKDELLRRLEMFEESNRHLRDLLRTADIETGRLRASEADREAANRRIMTLEGENAKLTKALAESEGVRASLQRQVHAREGDCERLTVQLRNVEKKYGRDAQEIMSNYEQLKRATRGWKTKWQKSEQELEDLRRQVTLVDADATDKTRDLQQRLEQSECDRERLRAQLDDCCRRLKDLDDVVMASRSGERELTTEMAALDRRLRETCGELEMLKRRNCELVAELEVAADREVQSRMSHDHASREFDILRERMASRCIELEELVAKLKNGTCSAAEARDCVLEMRLERCRDELEATRAKYNQVGRKLEEVQLHCDQTKATNRSLLDYIARLRKSYHENFGTIASEACPDTRR